MAIRKTKRGYQIRWYDASGEGRKRTYKGIFREQAEQIEREILHKRDYGEETLNPRQAPTFQEYAHHGLNSIDLSGKLRHFPSMRASSVSIFFRDSETNGSAKSRLKRLWISEPSSMIPAFRLDASIRFSSF
jgi:hypothetical protein